MAFNTISTDGVPSALLKQGMSLVDQSEEAPLTVTQEDGNRLAVTIDKSTTTYNAVNSATLENLGQVVPRWVPADGDSSTLRGSLIRIPPDVDEVRVYIDCSDTAATFAIYYDATFSTTNLLYENGDSIAMDGGTKANQVITDLVGIGFLGLSYQNTTGSNVTVNVRFSCETAYSLKP